MSHRHRWYGALLVACSVLGTVRSSPVQAQPKPPTNRAAANRALNGAVPGRPGAPQPMPMPVTFSGTLQQMRGGLLQVANDKQEQYVVKVDPRHTKVQCTGTAEPGFLRSGLYVRFSGEFDNRGTGSGELSELSIVTLSDAVRLGVVRDRTRGRGRKAQEKGQERRRQVRRRGTDSRHQERPTAGRRARP